MMKKELNLAGLYFNEWNVTEDVKPLRHGNRFNIRNYGLTSCGFKKQEKKTVKRDMSKHPLYFAWISMVRGSYLDYDLPNIKAGDTIACEQWKNPEIFIEWAEKQVDHEKKGYMVDRIDNDLGYSPENCKFKRMPMHDRNLKIWEFHIKVKNKEEEKTEKKLKAELKSLMIK